MSERLWYFMHNDEQKGPMPESQLRSLFRLGVFGTDTLVWSEHLSQWSPAYQIGELVPAAVTVEAPPPAGVGSVSTGALAATELVLLHGEKFATKAGWLGGANYHLIHMEEQVSYEELGRAMWGFALLLLEQHGVLRLTIQPKKAFLFRTIHVLVAEPTGTTAAWIPGTIEATIQDFLAQQSPKEVEQMIYILLKAKRSNPWAVLVSWAERSLLARNLAYKQAQKFLLINTFVAKATPETVAAAQAQDISWIQQLLAACPADKWQNITTAIKQAVNRRTQTNSGPDYTS